MKRFLIAAATFGVISGLAAAQSPAAKIAPTETAPDSGDWKGDLTGVWQGPYTPDLTRGTGAVLTPWGHEKFSQFDGKMDPCLPVGVTRQANAPDPIQIVQTPKRVVSSTSPGISSARSRLTGSTIQSVRIQPGSGPRSGSGTATPWSSMSQT